MKIPFSKLFGGSLLIVGAFAVAIVAGPASATTKPVKEYSAPANGVCNAHYTLKKNECVYTKPTPVTISIGVNYGSPALPIIVAQQLGFFKDWGVTANITNYASLGLLPSAVIGGSVQLGEATEPSLLSSAAKGIALITPANLSYGTAGAPSGPELMVMKSSGITTLAGLAGSKNTVVATSLGGNLDIAVHDGFREAGITGSSLPTFVTAPTTTIVNELVSGQVQAAELGTPYAQEAEQAGAVELLDPMSVKKGLQARIFLIGQAPYVNANHLAMAELRGALAQADKWIVRDGKAAKTILGNFTGTSAATLSILVMPTFTAAPSAPELSDWVAVMKNTGNLPATFSVNVRTLVEG